MQDRFETVFKEMFEKGIRLGDAQLALERHYIEQALAQTAGSLSKAADLLGMHRNTLTRKLAEHRRAGRKYDRAR